MPILLQGSMWHTQKSTDQGILRRQGQKVILDSREAMPTTAFHYFAISFGLVRISYVDVVDEYP